MSENKVQVQEYWDQSGRKSVTFIGTDLAGLPEEFKKLQTKLLTAVGALKAQPQIMAESLLEVTAWMGIPEHKRQKCIDEHVSNIQFIVDKVLKEIGDV